MRPTSIHLVGSVPLNNSAEVFEQLCGKIGPYLSRVPDGETGERGGWIAFQRTMLVKHPAVMVNPARRTLPVRDLAGKVSRENALLILNPNVSTDKITFNPLGYSQAAIDS